MKRVTAAIALILGAASYVRVEQKHGGHIVLPNSKLLACRASACSQLWPDDSPNPIYPRQVLVGDLHRLHRYKMQLAVRLPDECRPQSVRPFN
jgi:hypothetical protein